MCRPAFPLARSLEVKNGDKTTVEKLFETTDNSFATTNLASAEIQPSQERQERSADAGRGGHVQHRQGERQRTVRGGGLLQLGHQRVFCASTAIATCS